MMAIPTDRKFKRGNECPVCDGHTNMRPGNGTRCWGFLSENGRYVYCTREEFAGAAPYNSNAAAYVHFLGGPCRCGMTHDAGPVAVGPSTFYRTVDMIERELHAVVTRSEAARSEEQYAADSAEYDQLWREFQAAKLGTGTDGKPVIPWLPLAELVAPLPPINWICQGLRLAPGAVSCFSGYGYSGKTALAMLLLLAVANGRSFLDIMSCEQGVVGQLDYEQGKRLSVQRMQRLCRGVGLPLEEGLRNWRFCPFPEHYIDNEKGRDVITRSVDGMKLCVIDSGRASMPGIEENDSASRIHIDGLSRISERTGTAFLMILHDGKGGDEKRGKERTRGSSAMYDAMQTVWGFNKKDEEDFIRAELRKDRLTGAEGEFGIKFEDSPGLHDAIDSWVKIHHLDPEQMKGKTTLELRVDEVVKTAMTNPGLNKTQLASLVRGKTALTYTAIGLAEKANRITLVNGAYRAV